MKKQLYITNQDSSYIIKIPNILFVKSTIENSEICLENGEIIKTSILLEEIAQELYEVEYILKLDTNLIVNLRRIFHIDKEELTVEFNGIFNEIFCLKTNLSNINNLVCKMMERKI